jgi:hypothetical protein
MAADPSRAPCPLPDARFENGERRVSAASHAEPDAPRFFAAIFSARMRRGRRHNAISQPRPRTARLVKELAETADDTATLRELQSGGSSFRWIDPGARLRQSIKDSAGHLRKFSHRGFSTVICFFDSGSGTSLLEPLGDEFRVRLFSATMRKIFLGPSSHRTTLARGGPAQGP